MVKIRYYDEYEVIQSKNCFFLNIVNKLLKLKYTEEVSVSNTDLCQNPILKKKSFL